MRTPASEPGNDQPQFACLSCKTRKRRCDKVRPACSACIKRNSACEYLNPAEIRDLDPAARRPYYGFTNADDQVDGVQSLDFPTILFLDPMILQHGQIDDRSIAGPIEEHILDLLGDMNEIHIVARDYFEYIHTWMPFISKKRFYDIYLRAPFQHKPDVVLLLLCLKLITTLPPTDPRNPRTALYKTVKHFYLEVESSTTFSMLVLQSSVLLVLYELGHAIYPAAFLSLGTCARYAHALGIDVGNSTIGRRVLTRIEVEERKRVWWAIVILDRFVSIGCPGRPFVTEEPSMDDLLPTDDGAWDQGIVKADDTSTLSSPMTNHMSQFALLCQAARLLGQVLHHLSTDSAEAESESVSIQLDRTLQSMISACLELESPGHDQIAFVYSTLLALHAPRLAKHGSEAIKAARAERATAVNRQIIERVNANLVEKQCFVGRNPETMSPWGLYFAYRMCRAQMSDGGRFNNNVVASLKEGLLAVDARWNAAGMYIQLLEAWEVMSIN
ncbi:putative fungal-specific transcription factor [Xylariales sp. PMI_506]|nr:putative fungal-specific transcription factor [Xylariales sp. PMI_506]